MRILRIDGWDGPTAGGAQVYIARVSRALDQRGHPNVTAAIVTDPVPESLGPVRAYFVPRSPSRQALSDFTDASSLVRWLDAVAADVNPDIVHLHRFQTGFPGLAEWLSTRSEPIVFTAHDTELVCPIATLTLPNGTACPGGILPRCQFTGCQVGFGLPLNLAKRRSFDSQVKDRVRSFICVSHATQTIFENLGYRPTALLRPMIPVPDAPAPAPTGPFTVGFLGRFEKQKGVDVLLNAFTILQNRDPTARLRFAGSGPVPIPERTGVSVDGWVTDLRAWFGSIHALATPSLPWENLGNAPIEALAHGVPAVVTESGGLPETVGDFGWVVRPGDASGLASALLDIHDHPTEARQRALAGREWVRKEFSPEGHLDRLLAIYESTQNRSGLSPDRRAT